MKQTTQQTEESPATQSGPRPYQLTTTEKALLQGYYVAALTNKAAIFDIQAQLEAKRGELAAIQNQLQAALSTIGLAQGMTTVTLSADFNAITGA